MESRNYIPDGCKGLLNGKRGLIMGVANEKSLAWGIAEVCSDAGAELAITYQGPIVEKNARALAQQTNCPLVLSCDVTKADDITNLFDTISKKWGKLDFFVHAIAFSDRNQLRGRYVDTTVENFLYTMNVSCFSFTNS